MSGVTADDGTKLREMISGYMVSQVIFVAAALRLADLLAAGDTSVEALATATGRIVRRWLAYCAPSSPVDCSRSPKQDVSNLRLPAPCYAQTFRGRSAILR